MDPIVFKSMLVEEVREGQYIRTVVDRTLADLPEGEVLVKVHYSSLNYKDALSACGNKGVTRSYPHTPGIDAAGYVVESNVDSCAVGDAVLVTGYDLGMNTSGGFSEYIRVPASWLISVPEALSLREAMIWGTAGFTAALSVDALISAGVTPEDGEILVTGATGGVGSIAVQILSKCGYDVVALSGKTDSHVMLTQMGAKDVLDRSEFNDGSQRPMVRSRWAGVIDTVGGEILTTAIKAVKYGGAVTCCGNIAGDTFQSSVYPFILRGISLHGIDSVQCPRPKRQQLWDRIAKEWKLDFDESCITEVDLDGLSDRISLMMDGKLSGRTVVCL